MDVWAVRVTIAGSQFHLLAEHDGHEAAEHLAARITAATTLRLRPRTAPARFEWDVPGGRELTADEPDPVDREHPGSAWRDMAVADVQDVAVEQLDGPTALWHWAVVDHTSSGLPDAVG